MDPTGWPLAFLLTLLVETPIYGLALRRTFGLPGALLASLALNVATHPIAWSLITGAARPFPGTFLAVEAAAWVAEGLLLWGAARSRRARQRLGIGEALAVSLAANGFSAGIGLFL